MTTKELILLIKGIERYMEVADGGIIANISYIGTEDEERGVMFDMIGQQGEKFRWFAKLEEPDKRFTEWKFVIRNERGEDLLDYAEEMELTQESINYVRYNW